MARPLGGSKRIINSLVKVFSERPLKAGGSRPPSGPLNPRPGGAGSNMPGSQPPTVGKGSYPNSLFSRLQPQSPLIKNAAKRVSPDAAARGHLKITQSMAASMPQNASAARTGLGRSTIVGVLGLSAVTAQAYLDLTAGPDGETNLKDIADGLERTVADTVYKGETNHYELAKPDSKEHSYRTELDNISQLSGREAQANGLDDLIATIELDNKEHIRNGDTKRVFKTQNLKVLSFVVRAFGKLGIDTDGKASACILYAAAKYMTTEALQDDTVSFQGTETTIAKLTNAAILNSKEVEWIESAGLTMVHLVTGFGNPKLRALAMCLVHDAMEMVQGNEA